MAQHVEISTVPVAGDGVQWSLDAGTDLDANLVNLEPGHAMEAHVNGEVDVLVVGVGGGGTVEIGDERFELGPDVVVLVPKRTMRRIAAGPLGLRYLTVHRRRGPLRVGRADGG